MVAGGVSFIHFKFRSVGQSEDNLVVTAILPAVLTLNLELSKRVHVIGLLAIQALDVQQ